METKRIHYIDVAKGIGILLVAFAHADISIISPYLHQLIYAFHMPLFFFLSGFFFNPDTGFIMQVKKRFNTALKPYIITILFIYIASLSFTNMRFVTVGSRILKSIYATGYYIDWVQLWFLPSLFVTGILAFLFYRFVLMRVQNHIYRLIILLGVQAIGVIFLSEFYPFSLSLFGKQYELYGLPFNLDLVMVTGFFYLFGHEFRKIAIHTDLNNSWVLIVTGFGLIILTTQFNARIDLNTRVFESFPLNTLEAVFGILFTMALSKQIDQRTHRLSNALKYIGQASLIIFIFHVPIQEYWGEKLLFVTNLQGVSILSAFAISILISLGIYRLFFEKNPVALVWFGRKASSPANQIKEDKVP